MSRSGPAAGTSPDVAKYALLLSLGLAWGTSFMFTKIAVAEIPPFSLIAVRTVIATLALMLFRGLRGSVGPFSRRDIAAFALIGLIANAAPLCLIALSVSHVDSSVTATTMALVPLITAFFAIFRGEYPTRHHVVGILIGLAGILVLFGPQAFSYFGGGAKGALAAAGASLIFSASLFAMDLVRHHDAATVTTLSTGFSALWTIPFALFVDGVPTAAPSASVIGAMLVLALYNTAASNLLMFALVSRAGATFTAFNNYIVPAVAVVCGAVFLGEAFTLQSLAGVALVLAGVAISTVRRRELPESGSPGG